MRKTYIYLILLVIIFYCCGCSINSGREASQRIVSPRTNSVLIQGKWVVQKVLNTKKSTRNRGDWIGKTAEFSSQYAVVGEYSLNEPSYRIRRLNTQEYLLFNHKSFGSEIKIPDTDTDIITVSGKDKYMCEILAVDNKDIILSINNYNLYLIKVSDKFDKNLAKKLSSNDVDSYNYDENTSPVKMDKIVRTGLLLGFRSPLTEEKTNSDDKMTEYSYRTLWVSAINRNLHPILETNNIFFPRRSGFWKMGVSTINKQGYSSDRLYAYNISINENKKTMNLNKETKGNVLNNEYSSSVINYIGNDYVSLENNTNMTGERLSRLSIVPIDSLPLLKPVKMKDITGIEENNQITVNYHKLIDALKNEGVEIIDGNNLDENFGLKRNAGHWYFIGRINYRENNKAYFKDYIINLIPSSSLIFYDDLSISWNNIKNKVPEAVDAYTSPNKDLALVLTKDNKVLIYQINNNMLGSQPIKILKLKKGERIIMAEWATGGYVENWEKAFVNLNSIK